ncbi:MAG: hypothetical protein HUU01_22245 [Saprospiraceae bacterium]|nr:hypothetical protein [Saprospiraceae bacterium]
MNRIPLLCFVLALATLGSSCQQERKTGETVITSEKPIDKRNPEKPVVNPYETPVSGAFADPVPQVKSPIVQFLTTNYWVFEHYIHAQEFEPGKSNDFRWYKFSPDGSFTAGQWEFVKSKGSWMMGFGENNEPVLTIDSDNDAEDAQWVLQATPEGDEMSWVGVRSTRYQGHMIKVFNLMTMPVKKQFGRE